ncbi:NADH-quinone oxidoreductase subunit J [Desulfothermus naphthae]
MEMLLFFFFAIVCIISSLGVVFFKNPVKSAISLIVNFFSMGAIYIILNAEFIGLMQVLVYAGAIMVLFLFIIMLLDVKHTTKEIIYFKNNLSIVLCFCFIFLAIIFSVATSLYNAGLMKGIKGLDWMFLDNSNTKAIGKVLFTKYLLPFEVTSLLLLVAVIGIIVLGKKKNT